MTSWCWCPPRARCWSGSADHTGGIGIARGAGDVGLRTCWTGLVLAVMVLPIVAAITREVLADGARASSRRRPTRSARPAGRWCARRCCRGRARASSARRRSAWDARWGRRSRSRCCWATRPTSLGSLLGPGVDAGERHRAGVRRGERSSSCPPCTALAVVLFVIVVHHQRAGAPPGGPHGSGRRAREGARRAPRPRRHAGQWRRGRRRTPPSPRPPPSRPGPPGRGAEGRAAPSARAGVGHRGPPTSAVVDRHAARAAGWGAVYLCLASALVPLGFDPREDPGRGRCRRSSWELLHAPCQPGRPLLERRRDLERAGRHAAS